jgi:hypothetical protein
MKTICHVQVVGFVFRDVKETSLHRVVCNKYCKHGFRKTAIDCKQLFWRVISISQRDEASGVTPVEFMNKHASVYLFKVASNSTVCF